MVFKKKKGESEGKSLVCIGKLVIGGCYGCHCSFLFLSVQWEKKKKKNLLKREKIC